MIQLSRKATLIITSLTATILISILDGRPVPQGKVENWSHDTSIAMTCLEQNVTDMRCTSPAVPASSAQEGATNSSSPTQQWDTETKIPSGCKGGDVTVVGASFSRGVFEIVTPVRLDFALHEIQKALNVDIDVVWAEVEHFTPLSRDAIVQHRLEDLPRGKDAFTQHTDQIILALLDSQAKEACVVTKSDDGKRLLIQPKNRGDLMGAHWCDLGLRLFPRVTEKRLDYLDVRNCPIQTVFETLGNRLSGGMGTFLEIEVDWQRIEAKTPLRRDTPFNSHFSDTAEKTVLVTSKQFFEDLLASACPHHEFDVQYLMTDKGHVTVTILP